MNDPWDVKSVRQSGQYVSCMRINGVPLLPPVLSKECRKEMQYYKLLAKEVEKRISVLKPYVIDCDSDTSEDKTDAPELPESDQSYELPQEEIQAGFNINIDKITAVTKETTLEKSLINSPLPYSVTADFYNNVTSHVTVSNTIGTPTVTNSPKKFVIDLSLSINENGRNVLETLKKSPPNSTPPIDLPERDYDCLRKPQKVMLTDVDSSSRKDKQKSAVEDVVNFSFSLDKDILSDPFPDLSINQDGPSSLSSKSFTGSLIDIHTESMKESQMGPQLTRQRSYTLLKPSPQLLAHLEVQSLNTGIDMNCISMSESFSNLSSPNKKRRSWDLESAKVKWSSMALELKQKNMTGAARVNGANKTNGASPKPLPKKTQHPSPSRSRSVVQEKPRRPSMPAKTATKSEPIQRPPNKKSLSPVRNTPTSRAVPMKEPTAFNTPSSSKESVAPKPSTTPISESDDPAARVRELYEKIQKQQLIQMANLVEKQKKEQMLLQQVFEEQNNILYKQLKTICPKSPVEAKEAWADKNLERADRGPVSLSQLINHKTPEKSGCDSPVTTTLTETNNYINHCDDVLKRSKDISSNIKKQQPAVRPQNGAKTSSPRVTSDGSRTRTHSPVSRNTSRRLNYDTSASSEHDFGPMTDRTNDTMADLNTTFPSDYSDDGQTILNSTVVNKDVTVVHRAPSAGSVHHSRTPDSALKSAVEPLQTPMSLCRRSNKQLVSQPTPEQRAAATKIVAYAKGYLVRRLLRTERVQGTVQTIRDALLCALQLHQDREGIRGADVDLHRRLIQQITAACYALHDTFITSSPAERCAVIAADRSRRRALAQRPPQPRAQRPTDV